MNPLPLSLHSGFLHSVSEFLLCYTVSHPRIQYFSVFLLVWAITSTLWFMLLQLLLTYVLEARNNVRTHLDIPLLIYVCIYHSKWSGFLLMCIWISCLDYLKMCYHKNNKVWKFSDFVEVTGTNLNQVFEDYFPHNGTLVFCVN